MSEMDIFKAVLREKILTFWPALNPQTYPVSVIHPGEYVATTGQRILQTLLGSCVSACLYDKKVHVAGLNHFLLAAPRYPHKTEILYSDAGRYGVNAMELLINEMMKLGAQRNRLRAKVFGGARVLGVPGSEDFFQIHQVNQRFILEFLETEKIPVDAIDLGGNRGRVIYFNTKTLKVSMRYISPQKVEAVEHEARSYWKRAVKAGQETEMLFF